MLRSLLFFGRTDANEYLLSKVEPKEDGPECLNDCTDCAVQVQSNFKIDTTRLIYGNSKEFHSHVLVATGKSDWKEKKVEKEPGSLMQAFDEAKSEHGKIMVFASNLSPPDQSTAEDSSNQPTTVLILPYFTFIDSVTQGDVPELVVRYIDRSIEEHTGKSTVSSTGPSARPCNLDYVILLCSHRRCDARCGITVPLIKRELERHLRSLELDRDADDSRPGGVGIFFVSHVGGHKFYANVLVYRKKDQQMIWPARVRPEHCEGIVKYTVQQGTVVHPESQLRGGFDRIRGLTTLL